MYSTGHSYYNEPDTDHNETSSLSSHTPSRHSSLSPYTPGYHPYQQDWSYSRPLPDFSYKNNSIMGVQIESILESQKSMMKAQEDMAKMVKNIAERVGDLEKTVPSSAGECLKMPSQLSVSFLKMLNF